MVIVGLIATLAAAALATDEVGGSSVEIEWAARAPLPDSPVAAIPGGGSMRLEDGGLRVTEDNINGVLIVAAGLLSRWRLHNHPEALRGLMRSLSRP